MPFFILGGGVRPQPGPRKKPPQSLVALHCNICDKGGIISEDIFNLVPSFKENEPNYCPSTFYFIMKR